MTHLFWSNLFLVQCIIIFIWLLALSLCKFLKKFLKQIQSYWGVPFFGPKWSIWPKQFFFVEKLLISFLFICWSLSLCKILKTFLKQIQSYQDVPFLVQNGPIAQWEFFSENLLIKIFMPIYMPKIKVRY